MERSFEQKLINIKTQMLEMGNLVEQAVHAAVSALVSKDLNGFQEVHRLEAEINDFHMKLDDECLSFLALQGPVAKDLRVIFSIIKINSDLERMGDQAVNISYIGTEYIQHAQLALPKEIEEMTLIVRKMVHSSLESFVQENSELAEKILTLDDQVDLRKENIFQYMIEAIRRNPERVESAMDVILIARNLERLGDHATNIAEDVIFVVTGMDVRHRGPAAQ